jgi:hypothetical protein
MIGQNAQRHRTSTAVFAYGALFGAALALASCGATHSESAADDTAAPIALMPKQTASTQGVLTTGVDETELRKAIDRYRIVKHRSESAYISAGADLNGDGRAEALVLFSGQDWCQNTGCSLVIFQMEQTGYKPVSHIISARAPVGAGPDSSFGWRDLIVKTGGGNAPLRDVRLAFSGRGYPANALLQPEPTRETLAQVQPILAETAAPPAVN